MSFSCKHEGCERVFARSENLRRHVRSHGLIQPHQCPVCGKTFSRADLRRRHESTHQNRPIRQRSRQALSTPVLEDSPDQSINTVSEPTQHDHQQVPEVLHMTNVGTTASNHINAGNQQGSLPENLLDSDLWTSIGNAQLDVFGEWFDETFLSAVAETNIFNEIPESSFDQLAQGSTSFPFNLSSSGDYSAPQPPIDSAIDIDGSSSSPPNDANEDERWPYAWNPRPSDVLVAKSVVVDDDDPIFQHYKPKVNLSLQCYQRIQEFLKLPVLHGSRKHNLEMPAVKVAELFIDLFLTRHAATSPVIHLPSMKSLDQLPDPLLAVMISIGATYSGVKHSRRFAIVLLDFTRIALHVLLELDNRMLREPMITYAAALNCYAGLWSGNKREFELSEVLRGAVVSYCRRGNLDYDLSPSHENQGPANKSLASLWREWVQAETRKRVEWTVYSLDCEFCFLINVPPLIATNEFALTECPCDDEYWRAASAKKWKQLLGPASVPPSKRFAYALRLYKEPRHDPGDVLLNTWTRRLVLLTLAVDIFQFRQKKLLLRLTHDDFDLDDDDSLSPPEEHRDQATKPPTATETHHCLDFACDSLKTGVSIGVKSELLTEKVRLETLMRFSTTISQGSESGQDGAMNKLAIDTVCLLNLEQLVINTCIEDLQNAIGKRGSSGIRDGMRRLRHWSTCQSGQAQRASGKATEIIQLVMAEMTANRASDSGPIDTSPVQIISFFLASLTLWAFLRTTDPQARATFEQSLSENTRKMLSRATASLGDGKEETPQFDKDHASFTEILFRYIAEVLTRMRPWGASLGLATLLYQRAKMRDN